MKTLILSALVLFMIGCSDNEKTKTGESTTTPVPEVTTTSLDGKTLYSTCVSCHGENGDKKALNVSNLLKGQNKDEIINKLNGYKDGTYGGNMKNTMTAQVKALDNEKIQALAEYISTLK